MRVTYDYLVSKENLINIVNVINCQNICVPFHFWKMDMSHNPRRERNSTVGQ